MTQDLNALLVRRIHNANRHNPGRLEIIYAHLDENGAGAVGFSFMGKKRSAVAQIHIPSTMGKCLISGRRNPNLDNLLRL